MGRPREIVLKTLQIFASEMKESKDEYSSNPASDHQTEQITLIPSCLVLLLAELHIPYLENIF